MGDNLVAIDLGTGRTALSLTAGTGYTCVLLDDKTVKCWGKGDEGQLGHGKQSDLKSPPSSAIELGTGRTVTAITAGNFHTCAMLDLSLIHI